MLMPHPFVLVTGCSSGIGLAAARKLGARGFTVIASARKGEDVALLQQQGLLAVQLDLADSASIEPVSYTHLDVYKRQARGERHLPGEPGSAPLALQPRHRGRELPAGGQTSRHR